LFHQENGEAGFRPGALSPHHPIPLFVADEII
jgi:hypothetical protein